MRRHFATAAPLTCLLLAMLAGNAQGFGLNNIYGSQTIGKPFYAEIPLQSAPTVSESCIRLLAAEGGNDFFIPDLKVSVAGPSNARRIVISSQSPVRNPMVQFLIDVRCGDAAMMREYLLLADNAPTERLPRRAEIGLSDVAPAPQAANAATSAGVAASEAGDVVLLSAATTLNAMARAIYPDDRAARDAYRAAFAAANPELFAGKDSIGAIALAAGTRLKAPAGVALPGTGSVQRETSTIKKSSAASAGGPAAATVKPTPRAKSDGKKADRLSVGTANPQMQMLADAIMRLEASTAERDKINSELVGGVSSALNSIIELKERISAQDEQVKQLITLQIESERARAREKEDELGTLGLLGLLLAAMGAGAGLIALHHTLAGRRQGPPAAATGAVLDWNDLPEDSSANLPQEPDVWAQATVEAESVAVVPPPPPIPASVSASSRPSAAAPAPASSPVLAPHVATPAAAPAPTLPPKEASVSEDAKQDMDLGGLLDLFGEQKAGVTATIQRLRATGSRDPEDWLGLVRQARVAGLMNSEDMQHVITEFKRLFNASLDHEPSDIGLETFPHVARQVQEAWGSHAGLTLLNNLLFDDREGGRSGFPELCFEELVTLREVLAVRLAMFGEAPITGAAAVASPPPDGRARAEHKRAEANMIEFELTLPPSEQP